MHILMLFKKKHNENIVVFIYKNKAWLFKGRHFLNSIPSKIK